MGETTKSELASLVKNAVTEALKSQPADLTCPDCQATFNSVPPYLDHRVQEYVGTALKGLKTKIEDFKVPTPEEFLTVCKDGVCKLIEETYDVTKKGEAAAPETPEEPEESHLFSHHDETPEVPEG